MRVGSDAEFAKTVRVIPNESSLPVYAVHAERALQLIRSGRATPEKEYGRGKRIAAIRMKPQRETECGNTHVARAGMLAAAGRSQKYTFNWARKGFAPNFRHKTIDSRDLHFFDQATIQARYGS